MGLDEEVLAQSYLVDEEYHLPLRQLIEDYFVILIDFDSLQIPFLFLVLAREFPDEIESGCMRFEVLRC